MNDENAVHFPGILILGSENRGICPYSTTFFSFLDERKEGKRKSRPLPRPRKLAGYMIDLENASHFLDILILGYKNRGLCPHTPIFFSFLDERKEDKRKSRPLPRPGKITGYMREVENVPGFGHTYSMYPQKHTTLPPPTPREDVIRGEREIRI